MRDNYLGLAFWVAVVLGGCVNAGDVPDLDAVGSAETAGSDVAADGASTADVLPDGGTPDVSDASVATDAETSLEDVDDVATQPDVSDDASGDATSPSDVSSDSETDGPAPDAAEDIAPECSEDAECQGEKAQCEVWACEAGSCVKSFVAAGDDVLCDDGVSCTKEDVCVEGGVCVGKPDDSLCDDGNVCTTDTCEPSAEESCKNLALEDGEPCVDDEPCTVSEQCLAGVCSGMEKVCDDGKECTLDSCDPDNGDCLHQPKSVGTLCNGGNKCTSGDTCDGNGSCLLGPVTIPPSCKDDNPCTTDLCDPTVVEANGNGGCKKTVLADNELCDDGDVCTNVDVCLSGQCVGTPLPNPGADQTEPPFCDDDNVCTASSCVAFEGCKHENLVAGTFCSDGDACTDGDSCKSGVCVPGDPLVCPAATECLDSYCDAGTGCVSAEEALGKECNIGGVDGVCSLAQCDGSGDCGVYLHGQTLLGSSGELHDVQALSDGGWILVGAVDSDVPAFGASCALIVRLGYDTEVLWQITPTCDGVPVPTASSAHAVDVFPDGSFAVVGAEHTGADLSVEKARLWVLSADGTDVVEHGIGTDDAPGPGWDVRVLDDQTLVTLLDEPVGDGAASRAVVRRYAPISTWMSDALTSDWSFEQTDNQNVAQSIEARRLFDVDGEAGHLGLIGTFVLSGQNIKQLIANFSLSELPDSIPAQVTYSEAGNGGQIPLQASHGLYWPAAPGGGADGDGPGCGRLFAWLWWRRVRGGG